MNRMVQVTRDLLLLSSTPRTQIAQECGVSLSWITKFLAGNIDSPSLDNVLKVFNYLTSGPTDK